MQNGDSWVATDRGNIQLYNGFFLRIGYKSGGSLANIIFQITSGKILAHWEGENTWSPDEYFCAFPYMIEVFP